VHLDLERLSQGTQIRRRRKGTSRAQEARIRRAEEALAADNDDWKLLKSVSRGGHANRSGKGDPSGGVPACLRG